MIKRSFLTLLTDDVQSTARFYVELFGYQSAFSSDWFEHLCSPDQPLIELGIMSNSSDVSPDGVSERMGGMLTLVVDDVDQIYADVLKRDIPVVEPPTDLFYGQRRMLITDPTGMLIDVSSPCDPDPEWMASLG